MQQDDAPLDAVEIVNQLQLAEVEYYILSKRWRQLESVLFVNPNVAKEIDPFTGQSILHLLSKIDDVPTFTLDMVILLNPIALAHRDSLGYLPIHYAAQYGTALMLRILSESYKLSLIERHRGRLAIHIAAEANSIHAVKFLVELDPSTLNDRTRQSPDSRDDSSYWSDGPVKCAEMMTNTTKNLSVVSGSLPLHCACRHYRCSDTILLLVEHNPYAAAQADDFGDFPLHILLRHGSLVDLSLVMALLHASPAVVYLRDKMGDLPLATAVIHRCQEMVIALLLELCPQAASEPDRTGKLPIHYVTLSGNERSHGLVMKLILCDLPVDINEQKHLMIREHSCSWHFILSCTNDFYFPAIQLILRRCNYIQILALSNSEDVEGKKATDVATPICLYEINAALRMAAGTLQVIDPTPAYISMNSETEIFYGLKFEKSLFDSTLNDTDLFDISSKLTAYKDVKGSTIDSLSPLMTQFVERKLKEIRAERCRRVVLKTTLRRDVFERETAVRRDYNLSPNYVATILSTHPSLNVHLGLNIRKGVHCIALERADTTLENMLSDLVLSSDHSTIELILEIATPLCYLHRQSLVHGDFGPHNIGKFGKRFKLLGVGGCTPFGHFSCVQRGFYIPPEAIKVGTGALLRNMFTWKNRKNRILSVRSYPSFDIWALGCTVFQLVTGSPLPMYANVTKAPRLKMIKSFTLKKLSKAMSRSKRHIHPQLLDLIVQMLHPDPRRRISSMEGVIFRLESSLGGGRIGIMQRHVTPLHCLSMHCSFDSFGVEVASSVSSSGSYDSIDHDYHRVTTKIKDELVVESTHDTTSLHSAISDKTLEEQVPFLFQEENPGVDYIEASDVTPLLSIQPSIIPVQEARPTEKVAMEVHEKKLLEVSLCSLRRNLSNNSPVSDDLSRNNIDKTSTAFGTPQLHKKEI